MSRAARVGLLLAVAGWIAVGFEVWRLWPALEQLVDPTRTRTFYIPSESMLPTLRVDDKVRPRFVEDAQLRRGQVIVFQAATSARIARIVGTGGDTVASRDGRVILNGTAVVDRDVGAGPAIDGRPSRLHRERLPGEAGSHLTLDAGEGAGDAYGPVRVPSGRLFVLGDNRDRLADSRFPVSEYGVGMVPIGDVVGVVDRLLWASGLRQLGRPIDLVAR